METHPIDLAAKVLGSQVALAAALGTTKAVVNQWKRARVPAEYCPKIELLTDGQVRCEQLRPDIAWHVVRGTNAPKRTAKAV